MGPSRQSHLGPSRIGTKSTKKGPSGLHPFYKLSKILFNSRRFVRFLSWQTILSTNFSLNGFIKNNNFLDQSVYHGLVMLFLFFESIWTLGLSSGRMASSAKIVLSYIKSESTILRQRIIPSVTRIIWPLSLQCTTPNFSTPKTKTLGIFRFFTGLGIFL